MVVLEPKLWMPLSVPVFRHGLALATSQRHAQRISITTRAQPSGDKDMGTRGKTEDSFEMPKMLHRSIYPVASQKPQEGKPAQLPKTVYTIRLSTGTLRGAGLDDNKSAVQVCLMGSNGQAMMHRIPQVESSLDSAETMKAICQLVEADAGANCDLDYSSAASTTSSSPYTFYRFQPGAVDEFSVVGPDVGPLKAILVGPESGTWQLDEVSITNSRESLTQRFMCRDWLGRSESSGAAYLTPLLLGTVMYGSGDQAKVLTQEEANSVRQWGNEAFDDMKDRLMGTTLVLVIIGTGLATAAGGLQCGEAFAAGGCLSFVYQALLNRSVDSMTLDAAYEGGKAVSRFRETKFRDEWLSNFLSSNSNRLALGCCFLIAVTLSHQLWAGDLTNAEKINHQGSTFWTALLGFSMYRFATVAVTLSPEDDS